MSKFSLESMLPFQSHFAVVDGQRMHYLDEGSGPVVVLLHGNPTWCFYFRNLLRDLRQYFRVIVPDHIGCGLSDRPTSCHYRAIDRVGHIKALLQQLGIERCSLVMHDWGGPIGTGFAVRNIPMIERLVYLNTTLTETESLPLVIKLAAAPVVGKFITQWSKRFLYLTTNWGVTRKLPKEVRDGYLYPYRGANRRTALWDFVADIPFDSSHPSYVEMLVMADKLPELRHVPVQIVWGLRDPCFHREMLSKVAQHFPQASIREIPDASHLVLEDAPEICIDTIRNFLLGLKPSQVETTKEEDGQRSHTLYANLQKHIGKSGAESAIIVPNFFPDTVRYTQLSFKDLGLLINRYERGLTDLGLGPGDRVLMLVSPGIDFLALSYAVMGRAAIPIYLDPGMGRKNLLHCIREAAPNAFIGSPKAHLLRYLKPTLFKNLKFSLCASEWLSWGSAGLATFKKYSSQPLPPAPAPEIALVAFTSGGTGIPKGVLFSQTMIAQQLEIFSKTFGLKAGQKDMPLLPIFSLFSLALGVCSVFPPIDPARPLSLAPEKLAKIVEDLSVSFSFGSPTLWNKIAEYCVRARIQLPSLERIFLAGAPVPLSTMQRVREIAPKAQISTPYGATEALPVTYITSEALFGSRPIPAVSGEQGTLVGKAVFGLDLRIIRSIEGEIPNVSQAEFLGPLEIGEVAVRGANISSTYLNRPDATRLAKIPDQQGFWHRMGDMGYLDAAGNLYFCGRKSHVVQGSEQTYFSEPVELIFNRHEKVKRSALVALKSGRDIQAAVVIEPHPQYWPQSESVREELRQELLKIAHSERLTAKIEKIFFHSSFPVDARHNAKIFRDRLGELASKGKCL